MGCRSRVGCSLPVRYEYLLDGRLHTSSSLAKHFRTSRNRTHMHQLHTLALYLIYHNRQNLLLFLLIFRQEHQPRAILSFLRHGDALQQNELVGYLQHNTRSVTCLVACLGTSVFHIFKHAQRLVNQFMALAAMYIHHHTHATCIMFILALVQPSLCALFTHCSLLQIHIILA